MIKVYLPSFSSSSQSPIDGIDGNLSLKSTKIIQVVYNLVISICQKKNSKSK